MSSNINGYNIDGNFPIAGQDNDSQGFRDNFTNIRTNFTFAKDEIEDLQNKVVLKSALTGGTVNNTFNNVLFTGVKTKAFSEAVYAFGASTGSVDVAFTNGQLQTILTTAAITLGFSAWPAAGAHAQIRVWISVAHVSHTVTLPASVTLGKDEIVGLNGSVLTFPATGEYILEFSTVDGGTNVCIQEITAKLQKAKVIRGAPVSNIGAVGDVAGLLGADATHLYVCTGTYDALTAIWKRITLSSY